MKSCLVFGCAVIAVASARQPAHNLPSGGIPVDVCMEPTQELLISTTQAKSLVSAIFSPIGVQLTWHTGLSDCEDLPGQPFRTAYTIRWAEHAPYTAHDGALAAARPYGTSITIYKAALEGFLREYPHSPEFVLGYILAHELAHIMQGFDRHSASGILKASWSYSEYYRMLSRTLTFTAEDEALIRAGLEAKKPMIAAIK